MAPRYLQVFCCSFPLVRCSASRASHTLSGQVAPERNNVCCISCGFPGVPTNTPAHRPSRPALLIMARPGWLLLALALAASVAPGADADTTAPDAASVVPAECDPELGDADCLDAAAARCAAATMTEPGSDSASSRHVCVECDSDRNCQLGAAGKSGMTSKSGVTSNHKVRAGGR